MTGWWILGAFSAGYLLRGWLAVLYERQRQRDRQA